MNYSRILLLHSKLYQVIVSNKPWISLFLSLSSLPLFISVQIITRMWTYYWFNKRWADRLEIYRAKIYKFLHYFFSNIKNGSSCYRGDIKCRDRAIEAQGLTSWAFVVSWRFDYLVRLFYSLVHNWRFILYLISICILIKIVFRYWETDNLKFLRANF